MRTARILNIVAIILFGISIIIMNPMIIYLSIGFLAASMIYWRIMVNKTRKNDTDNT